MPFNIVIQADKNSEAVLENSLFSSVWNPVAAAILALTAIVTFPWVYSASSG
jgi:hypothetical protein